MLWPCGRVLAPRDERRGTGGMGDGEREGRVDWTEVARERQGRGRVRMEGVGVGAQSGKDLVLLELAARAPSMASIMGGMLEMLPLAGVGGGVAGRAF